MLPPWGGFHPAAKGAGHGVLREVRRGGFVETRMGKRGGIRKTLCGECKGLKKVTVETELLHYVGCAPAYIETLSFATTNAPPHEAESTLRHK